MPPLVDLAAATADDLTDLIFGEPCDLMISLKMRAKRSGFFEESGTSHKLTHRCLRIWLRTDFG